MRKAFADTLYWLAVVSPSDPWKESAERAKGSLGPARLVTTDEVLAEFLAALGKGGPILRHKAAETVRAIMKNVNVTVVPQSRDSFLRALDRYEGRHDKAYSLTDCSSMNVMDQEDIRDVLTNDHHFEQEGYNVLIKQ